MPATCQLKLSRRTSYHYVVLKGPIHNFYESDGGQPQSAIVAAHQPTSSLTLDQFTGEPSTECDSLPSSILRAHRFGVPLVLRPDDVYLAILSQVKFILMSQPARSQQTKGLRPIIEHMTTFPCHNDRAQGISLHLKAQSKNEMPTKDDIDAYIKAQVSDPELAKILFPGFTTSDPNDDIVRTTVFLSAGLDPEYTHPATTARGIPSVHLQGTVPDWTLLSELIAQLAQLNEAVASYTVMISPIVQRLVQTLAESDSAAVRSFWAQAVHHEHARRVSTVYTGWMTAFCMFSKRSAGCAKDVMEELQRFGDGVSRYELDGVRYPWVLHDEVPTMHVEIDVLLVHDEGNEAKGLVHGRMVAGLKEVENMFQGEIPGASESSGDGQETIRMGAVAPQAVWWVVAR